jgi:uncharacterized membrane protein YhfC
MEITMDLLIPLIDFVLLICLVLGVRWWQHKHGQLTQKKYALITLGYGTFFVITTMHPVYLETHSRIALWLEVGLLVIVWTVGYFYTRWLYKHFIARK